MHTALQYLRAKEERDTSEEHFNGQPVSYST